MRRIIAQCAHIRRVQMWTLADIGDGYWTLSINGRFPISIGMGRFIPFAMEVVKPLKGSYSFLIRAEDSEASCDPEHVFTFTRTIRAKLGLVDFRHHD